MLAITQLLKGLFERPLSVRHAALHHDVQFRALAREVGRRDAMVGHVYYFGTRCSEQLWSKSQNVVDRMARAIDQIASKARARMTSLRSWCDVELAAGGADGGEEGWLGCFL